MTKPKPKEKKYDRITINGNHKEVSMFKAICKFRRKVIGDELVKMLEVFNKRNKI